MTIHEFTTKKNVIILMLCIGLFQIAGYYLAGMLASPDGTMAVPQPDTLLYCQAPSGRACHDIMVRNGTAEYEAKCYREYIGRRQDDGVPSQIGQLNLKNAVETLART